MSARNGNPNDREHRARERERNRELQLMNVLRQHAQRQDRGGNMAAQNHLPAGVDGHRVAAPLHRSPADANPSTSRTTFANGPNNKRKCLSYGPESVESWAATEIEQETFAFLWTLKNFAAFTGSEEVKSPVFRGGPKSGHHWQLKMNPKKKSEDIEYFSVHLILTNFGDGDNTNSRKLKVRFQISLVDLDGRPGKQAGSSTMNVCEFKKCSVWGYDKFIQSTDLTAPNRRLIEDDQLKIHCRIWIEGDLRHRIGNGGAARQLVPEEEKVLKRKELLGSDFKTLLTSGSFADVALSTPTITFMCHKAILACRSSVFEAMFQANMLESANNTVEINDFDEDVVKGMLEYMYGGELEQLSEKAPDLMQIAEKYDLPGLKEDCENAIADNLTVENAAEILVMAHLYNASTLKPKVIEFINRNKDDVKKTKAFQKVAAANAAVFVELYLSQ